MLPPCAKHWRPHFRATGRSSPQQSESDRTSQGSYPCERSHPAYTIQKVPNAAIVGRARDSGIFRSGRRRLDVLATAGGSQERRRTPAALRPAAGIRAVRTSERARGNSYRFLHPVPRVTTTHLSEVSGRCPVVRESVPKDMQTSFQMVPRVSLVRPFPFFRAAVDDGRNSS